MRDKALKIIKDSLLSILILILTAIVSTLLAHLFDDDNMFVAPVFILAVAIISRITSGYFYGIAASVISVVFVNYTFIYPFLEFNLSITGYPLTFSVMLLVSIMISTLTTQIKKQEIMRLETDKEKLRANLLRSVSHDIRTPLASIIGSSSVLMENKDLTEEDRNELLAEINKDARWLTRLAENILSVTKFGTDGVVLKKTDEVVEEIVGSAIVKFRKNLDALPVTVSKPEEILFAPMDATLIEQVLINLFENAMTHGETAAQIEVTIKKSDDRITISVADDGVGISKAVLPHIFEGYVASSDKNSSDDRRNMGVGLSVCNSIICAHGGKMTAANRKTGGAVFEFWLPLGKGDNLYEIQ